MATLVPLHSARLDAEDDYDGWRSAARRLASHGVRPEDITWQVGDECADLFAGEDDMPLAGSKRNLRVPQAFLKLAETAICHSDPERFALLYGLLMRLQEQPKLLDDGADPLIARLGAMARTVRRDIHKMRAFVRFREVEDEGSPRFIAWFEPEHHIVRANAGFFIRRFAAMRWSILTPELSIHWDGEVLLDGPGVDSRHRPQADDAEGLWKLYYGAIFNPARVKIGAMLKEMPKRYWHNMPETELIPSLVAGAQQREQNMVARDPTPAPQSDSLGELEQEALACKRCPLWSHGTQTVFGEGPPDARLMLVGEQPGDQEDLAGRPFVGPAGQLLDRALEEAGIDRARVYVTNAVKHFKFTLRGKRRIHEKPNAGEIEACRWWIDQERAMVRPKVLLALGATAAQSVLGRKVKISDARGLPERLEDESEVRVTIHPSYLLRLPDKQLADAEYRRFVDDLRAANASAGA